MNYFFYSYSHLIILFCLFFTVADSTGTHSLYTTYKDYEIMFHVSTMLPYTPNNKQQVRDPCVLSVSSPLFPFLEARVASL